MHLRQFLAALFVLWASPAIAQSWPDKPIRLVVPFPAGGAVDTLARHIAPRLAEGLGQPIVIESRSGAGGSIGTGAVAKSPPDGYTLLLVFDTHAVNPSIMKDLPFDTQKDLAAVSLVATSPLALVANPKVPANSLKELVELAKREPNSVAYASVGAGSLGHLTMAAFAKATGIELNHIPYRGGAPAVTDLIGGQVQLFLTTTFVAKPLVDAGKAKAIAVTSKVRSPAMPDVPTGAEAGYPAFEATSWYALLAPGGTPMPIVDRVRAELIKVLEDPIVKERLTGQALTIIGSTPKEAEQFIANEIERWKIVVKENNVTVNP
jgi:tripartite-type tricarboxylate transporter receptor subunit TctC